VPLPPLLDTHTSPGAHMQPVLPPQVPPWLDSHAVLPELELLPLDEPELPPLELELELGLTAQQTHMLGSPHEFVLSVLQMVPLDWQVPPSDMQSVALPLELLDPAKQQGPTPLEGQLQSEPL
jgi:hypothetical protein